MTLFIGLTGSIGMGKSTTAEMFRAAGIPVYDSDATVHALYAGEAVALIEQQFPGTTANGVVDRSKLSSHVMGNEVAMKKLEAIVHPLVRAKELFFREKVSAQNAAFAVLDIPLLFETQGQERVDAIIVVTAPADVQKERVLAREGMMQEKFEAILSRQTPDEIKRAQADFVIDTSISLNDARTQVNDIIAILQKPDWTKVGLKDA